jgi:hypothetical protein
MTIVVVATSSLTNKTAGAMVYYTMELDLLFKVRMQSDKEADSYEIALQNYIMMKQKDQQ